MDPAWARVFFRSEADGMQAWVASPAERNLVRKNPEVTRLVS